MLGFGALGQFALGQGPESIVFRPQFIIDDADSAKRRKKRRQQQEEVINEIALRKEETRGAIYDALHPQEEFETREFNPSLFATPNFPIVLPSDQIVGSILKARLMAQQHQKMLADQEDENDIEMLLKG